MNIQGKIALITGVAGGIGRALSLEMARKGVGQLALIDQTPDVLELARVINELMGHHCHRLPWRRHGPNIPK